MLNHHSSLISEVQLKRPVLVHYHIFKNAGTSFEWALERALGKRFGRYDGVAHGVLSSAEIDQYITRMPEIDALSSHQATLPPPAILGREVLTSILLRDPIARIRSIYAFERRQNAVTPGAMKAKELDFKGYVEWRLATAPAMLCNYQVHFCSRTKGESGRKQDDKIQLQQAIANLDQINIVGTVERYADWLALAQAILCVAFPEIILAAERRNVTNVERRANTEAAILDDLVEDLGQNLAEELLQRNELDMCLHQVADSLLTRGLAEHGVNITLVNAYADARRRLPLKPASGSVAHP